MRQLKRVFFLAAPLAVVAGLILTHAQQSAAESTDTEETFTIPAREFFPHWENKHIAYGAVTGEVEEQPINFSHQLHAGTLGVDCQYCHSTARRTVHAGVPPTQTCWGCHAQIDTKDRPELEKLKGYVDRGEPIPWQKVHDLPDFVYFSHKRHVTAGVQCSECHGAVETMTVAQRVNTLQMGWCLNCHSSHPSVDANYGAEAELRRAEMKDCLTCHK